MIKKYKICSSEYYTEEDKNLSKSYIVTYFNERRNEWRLVKNYDINDALKALANRQPHLFTEELLIDFSVTVPRVYIVSEFLDIMKYEGC